MCLFFRTARPNHEPIVSIVLLKPGVFIVFIGQAPGKVASSMSRRIAFLGLSGVAWSSYRFGCSPRKTAQKRTSRGSVSGAGCVKTTAVGRVLGEHRY